MTRSILSLCAGALFFGIAGMSPVLAQGMSKEGTAMSNPSGDKMAKPDTMGKTDSMAKPADKTDAMKKDDEKKKDAMSGGTAR